MDKCRGCYRSLHEVRITICEDIRKIRKIGFFGWNKREPLVEMCHFVNYNLVCAAMLYQFERFLVVKVAERVQELSRQKCHGCDAGYNLDQLHHCMILPIKDKIELFLPRAKDEALARLNNLFHLYQQTAWEDDEQVLIDGGRTFIVKLNVNHLMDRRYVNEDTVMENPYNTSWLADETEFLVTQIENNFNCQPPPLATLPPFLPLDLSDEGQKIAPKKSKKRKTDDC